MTSTACNIHKKGGHVVVSLFFLLYIKKGDMLSCPCFFSCKNGDMYCATCYNQEMGKRGENTIL